MSYQYTHKTYYYYDETLTQGLLNDYVSTINPANANGTHFVYLYNAGTMSSFTGSRHTPNPEVYSGEADEPTPSTQTSNYVNFTAAVNVNFAQAWSAASAFGSGNRIPNGIDLVDADTYATNITFAGGGEACAAGNNTRLNDLTFTDGGSAYLGGVYDVGEGNNTRYYATTGQKLNGLRAKQDLGELYLQTGASASATDVVVSRNMNALNIANDSGNHNVENRTGEGTVVNSVTVSGKLDRVHVGSGAQLNMLTVGLQRSFTSADLSAFGYFSSSYFGSGGRWVLSSATDMQIASGGTASNIYLNNGGTVYVFGPEDRVSSSWNETTQQWDVTTSYASGTGGTLTNLQMAMSGGLSFGGLAEGETWTSPNSVYLNSSSYKSHFLAPAPQSAYVEFQSNTVGSNISIGQGGSMRISSGASVVGISMGALTTSTFHTNSGNQMTWVGDRGAKLVIDGGFASNVVVEGAPLTRDYYFAAHDHFSTLSSSIQRDYYESHGSYLDSAVASASAAAQYNAYMSSRYNSAYQSDYGARYVGGEIIVQNGGTLLNASGFAYLYACEEPTVIFSSGSAHMSARIGEVVSKAVGTLSATVAVDGAAHLTSVTVAGGNIVMGSSGGVARWANQSNAQSNYALIENLNLRTSGLVGSNNSAMVFFGGYNGSGQQAVPVMSNGSQVSGSWDYYNYECIDPGEIHYLTGDKGLVVRDLGWGGQDFTYTGTGAVTINGLGTVILSGYHSRACSDSYYGKGPYLTPAENKYYFGVVKGVYDEENGGLIQKTILNGSGGFDWKGTLVVGSGGVVQDVGSKAGLKIANTLTSDSWNPVIDNDVSKKLVLVAGGSADNVVVNGKVTNYEITSSSLYKNNAALLVSSGATATNVSVLSNGIAMAEGGTIDGVYVGDGGLLYLSGWAGAVQVSDDYGTTLAGPQYLDTTVLNAVRLDKGGQLAATLDYGFRSGGHAPSVIANKGGGILNGVTANGVAYVSGLDYAGAITLTSGQQGIDLTVRGFKTITSRDSEGNPTAYTTTIASLNVSSGGIVKNATVGDEGAIYVSEGADVSGLTASGGRLIFENVGSSWGDYLPASAAVNGMAVKDGGILQVNSKFALTASGMQIGESAGLEVIIAKDADEDYAKTELNGTWATTWGSGTFHTNNGVLTGFGGQFGYEYRDLFYSSAYTSARLSMTFLNGGVLSGGDLRGYGFVTARNGGKIINTHIRGITANIGASGYASGLTATTESTGSAYNTNIYVYGSGALAENTLLSGGFLSVENGGTVNDVTMMAPEGYNGPAGNPTEIGPAEMEILAGGRANNVVASAGLITIYNGSYKDAGMSAATLSNADVHSAATLLVNEDGVVLDGTLNLGGSVVTTAERYEWVEVEVTDPDTGDVYTDWQRVTKNNAVAKASTLTVNFDLTERDGTEEGAMIDKLTNLQGVRLGTITVSATQENGTYILADGASDFNGTLDVYCEDSKLGSLTVGGQLIDNKWTYSLAKDKDGNKLCFTVECSGDIFPNIDDWDDLNTNGAKGKVGKFGKISNEASKKGEIGADDTIDYMAFELESAAKLSFSVSTDNAAKFSIYELVETEKAGTVTYSLKTLQSTALSAGATKVTSPLLLAKGTYYLSMEATSVNAAPYTIAVAPSTIFYDSAEIPGSKDNWEDLSEKGANGNVGAFGKVSQNASITDEIGEDDAIDYMGFELESAAKLSFRVSTGNAAKFSVYELVENVGASGKVTYSLKTLQSIVLGAGTTTVNTPLLLAKGTYYFSMEATNTNVANAAYTVAVAPSTIFYNSAEIPGTKDNWENLSEKGANGNVGTFGKVSQTASITDEIGEDDAIDYMGFELESAAKLSFSVSTGNAAIFSVYELVENVGAGGKVSYSLKTLQSIVLGAGTTTVNSPLLLAKGTYYLSMEASDTTAANASYTVAVAPSTIFYDSAEIPGTLDNWEDLSEKGANGNVGTFGKVSQDASLTDEIGEDDAIDYMGFELESAAKLSFSVSTGNAAIFSVYELVENVGAGGKVTYSLNTLQSIVLGAGTTTVNTPLLLAKGTYYFSMEASDTNVANAAYTVAVAPSTIFYDSAEIPGLKDNWEDLGENGANGKVGTFGKVTQDASITDEVGEYDVLDYMGFELESAAKLSFSVTTGNAAKFSVYELVETEDAVGNVTYSLKTLQSTVIGAGETTVTSLLPLAKGTYYFSMEATDTTAANAPYTVAVAPSTIYYQSDELPEDIDNWDNLKELGPNGKVGIFGIASEGASKSDEIGADDTIDYMRFELESAAKLSFSVTTDNAVRFSIYQLNENRASTGNVTYSLKTLQTTALGAGTTTDTSPLMLDKGTYYLSMEATNTTAASAPYTIAVAPSTIFFTEGDNTDDLDDIKEKGAEGSVESVGAINGESEGPVVEDWVGFGDAIDYKEFLLETPAALSFDVNSTDTVAFEICSMEESTNKKGVVTYSMKKLQSTTLKANEQKPTKELLLDAGTYYIKMKSTNARNGGDASYTVALNESCTFFTKGDNSDDWTDMKSKGAEGTVGNVGVINGNTEGPVVEDWVGFGDENDYKAFTLETAAALSFDVTATDSVYFGIFSLESHSKKGVVTYSTKMLQSITLKANEQTSTKELLLYAGTYYFKVKNNNAKNGGDASYTVALNESSTFFTKGDNSDDWTDMRSKGAEGAVGNVGGINGNMEGPVVEDWVGIGDEVDYKAFTLDAAARLSFNVTSTDALSFSIYELEKPGVSYYKLTSRQTVKLSNANGANDYSADTKELLLDAGTYYIGVKSTNAKKGGDASYTVTLNNFTEDDNSDDVWTTAPELAAGEVMDDWVGLGDDIDYRRLSVNGNGGFYSFNLSGAENKLKMTVYSVNADGSLKAVKSVSATANKSSVSTGAVVLAADTTYVLAVKATAASKGQNSAYTVSMTEQGVFTGADNNTWDTATLLEGDFQGCLGKGAGADMVDYFDLSAWEGGIALEMDAGAVKATFYDAEHRVVNQASVTYANGSVKSDVASINLKDGNKLTDSVQIAALDDSVKYLKIEANSSARNAYGIAVLG